MSKILIIEDEEAIADLEKDYLELSGCEVEIETRGDVGLERALKTDYDMFILDLMLPGVDGFEICKRIREEKNTPILMVSAKKDDIDKIRGLGLGADDYITKPFGTAELLARVRKFHHTQTDEIGGFSAGNMTLEEITRKIIEQALAENNGNQSLTARKLGISRSTLWRILSAPSGRE